MENGFGNNPHLDCVRICVRCGKSFVVGVAIMEACVLGVYGNGFLDSTISSHQQPTEFHFFAGEEQKPMKVDLPEDRADTRDPSRPKIYVFSGSTTTYINSFGS